MAFSVRLHDHTEINHSPLVYGIVDLNIRDGYDVFTGKQSTSKVIYCDNRTVS